jgi:hypothetical protein
MIRRALALVLAAFSRPTPLAARDGISPKELDDLAKAGIFKPQFVIPLQLAGHPLLVLLTEGGVFDSKSLENQLMLPVPADLAARLGVSRYAEMPLASYRDLVEAQLETIWTQAKADGVESGDRATLTQATQDVADLRDTLKAALIEGMVFVAQ